MSIANDVDFLPVPGDVPGNLSQENAGSVGSSTNGVRQISFTPNRLNDAGEVDGEVEDFLPEFCLVKRAR